MNGSSKFIIRINFSRENILNTFVSLIVVALLLVNILTFYTYISSSLGNTLYLILGIFSIAFCCVYKGVNHQKHYIIFVFLYTVCGLLSFFYNSNAEIVELLWPLGFMGIGLLQLNFKMKPRMLMVCFFIFCFFSIFSIYIAGSSLFLSTQTSRNNISVYALVYLCLYMFSCYKNKQSVSFLPCIIYFITCVFATGRGGIVVSSIVLILFLISDMKGGKSKRRKLWVALMVLLGAVVIFYIFNSNLGDFISFSFNRFQERGMQTSRNGIWSDYLSVTGTSILNMLFGSRIGGTYILDGFSTNLHNSFLMLHAKYGVFGLLLVLYLMYKSMRCFVKERNMYYIIPFIAVVVRMMLDYTNFNGILDVVLINIILYRYYFEGDMYVEE